MTCTSSNARDALGWARLWHDLGVATIPVMHKTKEPALRSWKRYQTALPTPRDLEVWFNGRPSNLAIITGRGLLVVDFDDPLAFSKWLISFPPEKALHLASTYQVRTARGKHLYYYCEAETDTHPGVRPSIDVKARGGYVLGPPSIHPAGHPYTAYRTPDAILTVPDLAHLNLKPKRQNGGATWGYEPPSLVDKAMRPTCTTTIDDLRGIYTSAGFLGLPAGRRHKINCPLPSHNDQHASFVLYQDGHFHCYGCGAHGGDFLDLYRALNGLDYVDAINELAIKAGLS